MTTQTIEISSWQRLERVMGWAGLNSVAFASILELSSPQVLYRIKAGKNGISRDLAERIASHLPSVSRSWLMTGEGSMLCAAQHKIPCYSVDCTSLAQLAQLPETDDTILLPDADDCDFAARTFSAAMSPDIQQGSLLVFRRIEPCNIVSGGIYLIVGLGGTVLLRRVKSVDVATVLLTAAANDFDDILFDATLIKRAYLVKFSIKNHSV